MAYQVTKKPWLGALLVFIFGPLGFLYYSWRKAIVTLLLFLLPNMILYGLDSTIAEVVRWSIQFLMASFAYLDLQGRLYVLDDILSKVFTALTVPIMFLNFFGGIISGIWLLFLGQWKLVIGAFIFTMFVPWAYSIVALVQMPLVAFLGWAEEKKKKTLCLVAGFINIFIGHAIILFYVFFVLDKALIISATRDLNIFAVLLFGYGVATSPFSYMASKEGPDAYGSILGVFVAQISYLLFAIAYLFNYPAISIPIILLIVFGIEIFQLYTVAQAFPDDEEIQPSYDY